MFLTQSAPWWTLDSTSNQAQLFVTDTAANPQTKSWLSQPHINFFFLKTTTTTTATMSKIAKPKHRQPSLHSRAARRATSPSLAGNVDKSLKDIQPPKRNPHTHIFSAHNAGISKKNKKGKQLTRGQLSRQKKGFERADIVKEQLELKKAKSMVRLKMVKERRKDWEMFNEVEAERVGKSGVMGGAGKFAVLEGVVDGEEEGSEDVQEAEEAANEVMKLDLPVRSVEQPDPSTEKLEDDEID
jgi:hypothetical protein